MKTPSSTTRRGNRVFKHHATSKKWTFQRVVNKRWYFVPVGLVLSEASKIVDEIDAYAVLHPMKEVVAKYRPNGSRISGERRKIPTCGEIIKRFQLLAPRDLGIVKRTVKNYSWRLRDIVRKGLLGRNWEGVRIDEVTPAVIRDFRRSCLDGVTNEEKIVSKKRTVNAHLRNARSLLGTRAMKLYADWGVSGAEHLLAADFYPRLLVLPQGVPV